MTNSKIIDIGFSYDTHRVRKHKKKHCTLSTFITINRSRKILKTVLLIFRYRYENMNPQIFTAKSTTVASKVQPAVIDTLTV